MSRPPPRLPCKETRPQRSASAFGTRTRPGVSGGVAAGQRGAVTAPFPILRTPTQRRRDRIERDVADHRQELCVVLDRLGAEPILEDVADTMVAVVEASPVESV